MRGEIVKLENDIVELKEALKSLSDRSKNHFESVRADLAALRECADTFDEENAKFFNDSGRRLRRFFILSVSALTVYGLAAPVVMNQNKQVNEPEDNSTTPNMVPHSTEDTAHYHEGLTP